MHQTYKQNVSAIMNEKSIGYVQQIRDGLTEEALDFINHNGYEDILSDEELSKLFHKEFSYDINYTPESDGLCLVFDKDYSEIELLSLDLQCVVHNVKCDIRNVQSIIAASIECLNGCVKLTLGSRLSNDEVNGILENILKGPSLMEELMQEKVSLGESFDLMQEARRCIYDIFNWNNFEEPDYGDEIRQWCDEHQDLIRLKFEEFEQNPPQPVLEKEQAISADDTELPF